MTFIKIFLSLYYSFNQYISVLAVTTSSLCSVQTADSNQKVAKNPQKLKLITQEVYASLLKSSQHNIDTKETHWLIFQEKKTVYFVAFLKTHSVQGLKM